MSEPPSIVVEQEHKRARREEEAAYWKRVKDADTAKRQAVAASTPMQQLEHGAPTFEHDFLGMLSTILQCDSEAESTIAMLLHVFKEAVERRAERALRYYLDMPAEKRPTHVLSLGHLSGHLGIPVAQKLGVPLVETETSYEYYCRDPRKEEHDNDSRRKSISFKDPNILPLNGGPIGMSEFLVDRTKFPAGSRVLLVDLVALNEYRFIAGVSMVQSSGPHPESTVVGTFAVLMSPCTRRQCIARAQPPALALFGSQHEFQLMPSLGTRRRVADLYAD